MTISGISGAYGSYGAYRATGRTTNSSALKISVVSENGSSEAVSAKVSNAMTDEYIERIKAQARADAAKGSYEDGYDSTPRTGFAAMRDAQMKQYVSSDRSKAISQVSAMLKNPKLTLHPGENLFDLLSIPFTATISKGAVFGKTAEIYNADGEMIAGYGDSFGWIDVPTADEMRFQSESMQIYYKAYKEAEAEIANGTQQAAAPAESSGTTGGFDVKV